MFSSEHRFQPLQFFIGKYPTADHKAFSVGISMEKLDPRPATTSSVNSVCGQYSNWLPLIQNSIKRSPVFSYRKRSAYSLSGGSGPASFYASPCQSPTFYNRQMAHVPDKHDSSSPTHGLLLLPSVPWTARARPASTRPRPAHKAYFFTLREVCFQIGFSDPNYFSHVFKKNRRHYSK